MALLALATILPSILRNESGSRALNERLSVSGQRSHRRMEKFDPVVTFILCFEPDYILGIVAKPSNQWAASGYI